MKTPHPSDGDGSDARVVAAMGGEPAAVDAWFRAEHPEVYRLCAGFLADATEAEDLAQDAMLKLLDNLHAWDRRRGWRPWRNTIVLNLCRDRLRRIGARRVAEQRAADGGTVTPLPVQLPDPLRAAQQSEVRAILMLALSELTLIPSGYDTEKRQLTLTSCEFSTRNQSFSTSTVVRAGEYTVLGATGSDPIFVVLQISPLDD